MTTPRDAMVGIMDHIEKCVNSKYTRKGVVILPTWDNLGHWIGNFFGSIMRIAY